MLELKSVELLMLSESGGEKPELITADPIQKKILYSGSPDSTVSVSTVPGLVRFSNSTK